MLKEEQEISIEKPEKAKRGRRAGQIVSRGENKWMIRAYLGADRCIGKRGRSEVTPAEPRRKEWRWDACFMG